jgi:Protein of unknown function (DUF2934)
MRTLLQTRSPRRVRTPWRVQFHPDRQITDAAGRSQEKYVFSVRNLEIAEKSEQPADSARGASDPHPVGARGKNHDGVVPVNWLSCESTSYLLDSEMEKAMKPESTTRNENEVRAAAPSSASTVSHSETSSAPATSLGQERADRHEEIRARAYELFLERGHRDGGDIIDWLDAEQEFDASPIEKSYRAVGAAAGKSN